jgi:hypothetical protein
MPDRRHPSALAALEANIAQLYKTAHRVQGLAVQLDNMGLEEDMRGLLAWLTSVQTQLLRRNPRSHRTGKIERLLEDQPGQYEEDPPYV